jgi:hypothetical protein
MTKQARTAVFRPNTAAHESAEFPVCDRCGRELPPADRLSHVQWHIKMRKKLFSDAQAMAAEAEEDKNAITVSHKEGLDFGVVGPDDSVYIDITILKSKFDRQSTIVLETISIRGDDPKSVFLKLEFEHSFPHIFLLEVFRDLVRKI